MILDTYIQDLDILEWGASHYPEIRFGYGPISINNYDSYIEMVDILKSLKRE